ncbi:microtubule-actin cross-linking factor 1 isoform X7 [Betta splendens]|uniref:Microtubule-actin cross-linking factor 1 isoform X7 n=1 Tax=Betta splendens TaxID=158456 RepID=A0A6P7NVG8_BETSP|nr:microtubule-actin cross-linking factor 1 isoform X7 [Betta splendens]
MGNSMGCVRPPRESDTSGAPPLSPKKRLRFRRKHKDRRNRKKEVEQGEWKQQSSHEKREQDEDEQAKAPLLETLDSGCSSKPRTLIPVPDSQLAHSKPYQGSNTLSPGSTTASVGGLLGSRLLEVSPKPSPAWRGVFCFPGEEDAVSANVDVSSIPSQTTSTTPVNTAPSLGSTTPGGGRVCRVKEKVQGVLEKPWILRQRREKKGRVSEEDQVEPQETQTPADTEHKGVVHIREVDGKLCVVRTVYPRDYGSPVWRGDGDMEVREDPPAPSPGTGHAPKVLLPEEDRSEGGGASSSNQMQQAVAVKGFKLGSLARAQERSNLLESGYGSDLPLTSPETAGTTPSQTDWGGLTSSSSERLDSMMESPQAAGRHLPQISEIYVSGESGDLTAKEKLLLWSQQATEGYPGLRCVNFTSSWSDGRMFNALLHRYRPDLIDMEVVSRQSNRDNLEQAFEIAESLGVTRLLDAEDVDVPSPDEKSVITYVSSIYDAFPKIPEGGEGIAAHDVDQRWSEYQSRFSSLLQWSRQHTALMANKNFPHNPVELKALYNEYVHFKETEIPAKEVEKGHIQHLYKLLEVWIEFGRIRLPQGLHPNDLEEEWGKLILEMLEREKVLRPAVERLEVLLQRANKIQNMALDCEEKLTLAKNTLQADMSRMESGDAVQCETELACYLQDCEALIRQLNLDLKVLKDEKYYQVEQLGFRVSCLQEELVSLRLQCSSVYRKGHFSQALGSSGAELTSQRATDSGLSLGQALLGAVGAVGAVGAALLRRPMARSQLVAMSSSEDEGSLRFIYELLGWVEETQELLERAEWGADLPSVETNLQEHNSVHGAVEELLSGLQEARSYEAKVSPNFKSSYSETLAKLEHQYCKLLEHSSWRLRSLESLHTFLTQCTEELIWLNEREEEEVSYDWSDYNTSINAKRELYSEMRLELDEKRDVMRSLQETSSRLCQENHPAKQTLEAYSAALQNQWQWVDQLCVCVEQHLKDNTAYFQFMSDARDCESYLRQLHETIKRQYTCDKNSRLSKLEDLLQDSMEEKEQLIECRSSVASLVGRAKTVVQLRPRSAETSLGATTLIRAVCDYKQIETNVQITISRGEECVLEDNSQRTKWKVISTTGNEAMVPSVCFTVPPPNQEAIDTASRTEQLYQKVMSLWHQLHVNMKSVVSWHYLLKDVRTVSEWDLDAVRCQSPTERQHVLDHLESQLSDFQSDSKESTLFTPADRQELEKEVQQALQHCQDLLVNMETAEKDESVSRSYLSELQNITLRLSEAEQRLMRGIQTPPPSRLSTDNTDNTMQIAQQETLQSELNSLRSTLGDVSRRCVSFFEEKSASSSVPILRSELNRAVEKLDRLHNLSSVYLEKLKTVDVLIRSLDEAESQVRKYESRLSEEDIVPADTTAIKNLREQLGKWQVELPEHEAVFLALQSEVQQAKEAGSRLSRLHPDRSPELELYEERASQMRERWSGVKRQLEMRKTDLESLGSALQQYRDGHSALVRWIEDTTQRQESSQPGQTDSKALSEQLAQQTALVAEIEQNQTKLDECHTHAKQYCTSVKDYELQQMTYRAFVESTHKSQIKRRRMHSSSEAITQEFMDLRTRYTALVTLTTQHVKYISDALRRLEEEEKEVEEEKQARVSQVSDLLGWVKGLQGRTGGPSAESSLAAQQAISEQLAAKKDDVAEAIRSTQIFLLSKQASKLSSEERAHVEAQLDELTATYNQLCDSSTQQLQQLEQQLAKAEETKKQSIIAGVIDLGTVETFPVFQAAQRGLIDQDTCRVLLEAQLILGGLVQPSSSLSITLEQGLDQELIDTDTRRFLSELESALLLVESTTPVGDQEPIVLPAAVAMELGICREEVGLRILELQINSGGLIDSMGRIMTLEQAEDMRLLTPRVLNKLQSRLQHRELIDPNTAEKLTLYELQQRCVLHEGSGLLLFPVKQQPGGTVCLRSGRKVGIFRAVQEGLIDRKVTARLLEAQLFAGGIADPRSGHRLTVEEAVRHGLMDQDLACAMFVRQLQNGGIIDPVSGERLDIEESIRRDLLSSRLALLVLESVWNFMGLLWPESGELLPVSEALQQGMISGELARSILRHRHSIGALYNPETLQVLPMSTAAGEGLNPGGVRLLRDIFIPDVLPNMNQAGAPCFNRLSWGSTSSSPPPSSPLRSHPTELQLEDTATDEVEPEEQARRKLLFHLMTYSYVDAHSGKRLVLLNSELMESIKAVELVAVDSVNGNEVESPSLSTVKQLKMQIMTESSLTDEGVREEHAVGGREEGCDEETDKNLLQKRPVGVDDYLNSTVKGEFGSYEDSEVKSEEKEMFTSNVASAKDPGEVVTTESKPSDNKNQEYERTILKEPILLEKANDVHSTHSPQTKSESIKLKVAVMEKISANNQPEAEFCESAVVKEAGDVDLPSLVLELKQGGIMTEDGQRLLPDEAVAQGVLQGHTAVHLMAQAGLFGGFLDAGSGEALSIEDVMQEGLLDEDLMWSVLKSDKTLSGVVDAEKRQIRGVREAAQAGLIDPNTAARLLEAQVASGGIVDLRRDKKVSVTLAADLGLIEEDQREELLALENACKGRATDSATSLKKADLQLQMDGVIDPEVKSPVPLEKALQQGLIGSEEAYQVLAKQVAEGGIIHHASGLRLPVADAVDRGLVDRSIAPGLEELEWVYQGKLSPSSHPEAVMLQPSTGAVLDPNTGRKLTLSEAVSEGLLDEKVATEALASPAVTQGALDPQSALIVPYSELVRQGKIDVETGKRFFEVKTFKGIKNEQTTDILTLSEAVTLKLVDPVPALRLLQSQADSGGVIDINNGERLALPEACERGLVGDDLVKTITSSHIMKGDLADVLIGQQGSSPSEATAGGLSSRDTASEKEEKVTSVEKIDKDASSDGTYSCASSQGSSANDVNEVNEVNDVNAEQFSQNGLVAQDTSKTITENETNTLSDQSPVYDSTTDEDKVEASLSDREEAQQSMDVLCSFTTKVEKRIQQAIKEIAPQKDTSTSENPPQPEACGTEDEQNQDALRRSVGESVVQGCDTDKGLQEQRRKGDTSLKCGEAPVTVPKEEDHRPSDEVTSVADHVPEVESQTVSLTADARDERRDKESYKCPELIEEEHRKREVAAQRDEGLDVKDEVTDVKSSADVEKVTPGLTAQSKETESKTKKKRKPKKKAKVKEAEGELQPPPTEHTSEIKEQPDSTNLMTNELASQDKHGKSERQSQTVSPTPDEKSEAKAETGSDLVKQETDKDILKVKGRFEPEMNARKMTTLKEDKYEKGSEMKTVEQNEKVREKTSVSQPPEISLEVKTMKSTLPEDEKAALILKAKESILKKVFEKGVSEKQAAEELQALRKEAVRRPDTGKDVKGESREPLTGSPGQTEEEVMLSNTREEKVFVQVEDKSLEASNETQRVNAHKDAGAPPSVQPKETQQSKRSKKNKKSKSSKATEQQPAEPETPTLQTHKQLQSDPTTANIHTRKALPSDVIQPPASDEAKVDTDRITHRCPPEELSHSQEPGPPAGDAAKETSFSFCLVQPEAQAAAADARCDGESETRNETRERKGPKAENEPHPDSPGSRALLSANESPGESATDAKEEADVRERREDVSGKEETASLAAESSLKRQQCLELDQRIVALVSVVRHIEVRLKQQQQQQQQSVGRSLVALDDVITRTETLDFELRDLEPEVAKEVEAAAQLVEPEPKDVPPQLLLALEKDARSLARGFEAARALSEGVIERLRGHRDSYKEAVAAEHKALGGRVEALLSWLRETEAQMDGAMAKMEKDEAEKGDGQDPLTQQLKLCEELQSVLMARSSEVGSVASDIQALVSERAQDLAPGQSRQLLGQLQQLQRDFHRAWGQAQAWAQALAAQRGRQEDRERQSTMQREVVQQQKAQCSQKLEGLTKWLAGAASLLASQQAGVESGDVTVLKEKQRKLKEAQRDLQSKGEAIAEAVRSIEEFLAERGDSLSPEEREDLQGALTRMKQQYSSLTDSANTSLSELDTTINTTVQQNTQRAKAVEELQETRGQIDSLLNELSCLQQPADSVDASFSPPEGAVLSRAEMLQAELQQLQSQQAKVLQVSQSVRSLLDQPDATVPPEEKQRLRAALDQLQAQHQDRLQSCQDRLRKSETLKDELAKFLQEHGSLCSWLEQSERELHSLGEGETDAQGLKCRLDEHRKLAEDVICHKADLRFVSISGQKVLDSVQGAQEQVGGSDPALNSTKEMVTKKLQDANHRYTTLHSKSSELGSRLSGLLERYQQYQDEVVSLHSWLSTQEQNQSIAKPSGDTDPQNLQTTLRQVQLLQDELAERSVQVERVKRAGKDLVSADESPSLKAVDILCAADGLEKRFGSLSASVSERAEQLQTAVAQSVSVQEGLKGLLSWLDKLVVNPGPVEATAQAVQDALTQNQKLRQELLSRQGSVEATRDSVSKLLQSSDASTASGLKMALDDLSQRYAAAQASQAEREAELKGLLPRLESYERLGTDLQVFTQSRVKALGPVGQPDRSVDDYRQTIEEVRAELEQESGQLKSFCHLGTELSQSKAFSNTQSLLDNVRGVSEKFTQLEANVNERFAAIQACEQQLLQFRGLSGSLLRWLETAQDQLPPKEANLNIEGLQRRVQQLKDLLNDWESQGTRVQELNKTGSELESLIINITAPQPKTGSPQINGSAGPSSVNGIHTCKDLTELQVAVSDVNGRYEILGGELKERLGHQQASLDLREKARQGTEELKNWLADKEHSLKQGQTASPSRPEVVRAQAEANKALLSELAENSVKIEQLKSTLRKLIAENPDSPEADTWRQQLQEIDSRWQAANQTAAQRQTELETCADRLGSFASAANQLGPWLREKELMMSVLGPLSIDPNMLNTQKQQAQFMLREFETRRPQFDQLTQSAEGILCPTGDSAQDPKALEEVRSELGSISQQWEDLTNRLTQRSDHIDQALGTSQRYQTLLRELSSSVAALSERLDAQASLSAQPEALKRRLQETGEIHSELERRRTELSEAEKLCRELSAIVAEPYLKEELNKRLESVSGPLRSLEERAADGLSQLQAALSSTQQFQQMFEELRSWLDEQSGPRDPTEALPCQPEAIRSLLGHTDALQRGAASQRGSYELIQAEGASLLASLPAGGDERSALQSRLASLRCDWEGLNQRISDRESKLKSTLGKAETYQQYKAELIPWLAACEGRDGEIQPSLDSSNLEEALQKARSLSLDLERRQPLLESFNTAADQLLEQCCLGEEEVRDEKAQLNRRVDDLGESLHKRTSHLEELAGRLKEFEEGRQTVERRLEAAKHQIEVQEALGPQACSAKSLERLRSQQESLRSLQPQVVYLKDLVQGLVQDAPQTPGHGTEGAQRLQEQAGNTERQFADVTDKIEHCCSSLESRLQGVGEVQSHVRDVFSQLADLDDELDSLSPVGRDADSLASQADALKGFLSRLAGLRTELEGHASECTTMLRREGSSPDLLALKRETEALSRQAGKLSERGQARLDQIEDAAERVREFYKLVTELQSMLGRAEEGLNAQGMVGTEVEMIRQQLREFKAVEREQVDSIQPKLQHVNAVGQGLIQSAGKHTDTQALEHDLETTNLRWNSLNKRVAERIAQLQEALLHCGKFQDALEPLLSWLSDTEELVANQKPPSAEYRVVKAQIQEQKLLQRLLDDRRPTVEMIRAEGQRIAATADTQDQEKIQTQLKSLAERWTDLLDKASARQRQLEELQVLALQFHEALEPLGEWLSATERRLSSAEPMGTQTAKISQQIIRHKALQEDVSSREAEVDRLERLSQSLTPLSCAADRGWLGERVGAVRTGHSELARWCSVRAGLLEQALANAQLFGEEEVEVLNWLAEVAQRLAQVSVQGYQPQLLAAQHEHSLSLNDEILSRKKTVDQAIKNGQALLKQTTGEEVLLIQEKLDGIKSRYAEMTASSSKALRTLEQALQLSTRFASAHDDLNQWLDGVEAELSTAEPDATPAYQERQKELKKVSAEKRLVLDTLNEVGNALLDLVPWRAREGLDRLVADANQRYRQADETITQRVQLVQAAIQRSQQYEEAVDAELAWVGETERKLASLGPLSLEPDVTVAQLQVQRAFNIDIIRHKDTVDQLLGTRDEILETCSDAQKDALMIKTESLSARYDAVSQSHSERFSALEQAQVLVGRFWETYEELEPWLGETETLITQLPPPAIDTDALRLQQDQMRLLRESIAEHKPHIDKLLKIGPRLAELSTQEGATVTQRYTEAERRYLAIKEEVKGRAAALDEAVSQSVQLVEFHDKMDPLLETLEGAVQRLRQPPPVAAEVEKIREQLAEHRSQGLELDKLLPSFSALCSRGEELIGRAAHDDPAAQAVRSRLLRLRSLWDEIRQRAEDREGKLNDVLDLAGKFWADVAALLSTLRDSQDIVRELEDPGVDPSLIKQQIEAAEAIKAETDGLREELEFVRTLGADLIFACGETEKPEVKKTIDEMNAAWEGLNRTWKERMERLEEAMAASVQYQDALQSMFDYLDNAVIKLCEMSTVGTDLGTVKQQIEELKQYKVEVYQQQIDMEKLCHQGELLLKKVSDQTDKDMIQEPLTELRHLWDNLGDKITQRQHKLEAALLALGQFQHALSELQAWLSHTHTTLDTQRPVSSDPKAIEIELAKHHVLRNDVLSHHATVETVNSAAAELLESSPGDEASHLREQLDQLHQSWESLLLKTQERQKLLEAALQQAEGFHGELEEFLQWLRRTESQLSAAKPTGGLPETAREQLQQHMELQALLSQRADQYHRLLDQGESMLLARGEEAGPGATQTQQNLAMLQNKWASLTTKMEDRRAKLEEAVALATGFQTSLQDTINWLTQAEQTLNMAQPPSLMLDTVLFQIDEHKVFVNEVNTHREQVLALEKAGSQLRFASLKQDVVLIKNLLLSVQARWDKLVQRSLDRGRHLDEARKRAKQFHEAWRKLTDWLEEAEKRLDSELEISNEPDKIKVQLTKHKEFQKALGSKQPVYDTTVRSGRAMRDKAQLPADTQKLDHLVGEVRDKWDTVCGKSVERQHKLEEALLFSGQFAEALQALVDWLYRVEPQLAEDQPVHGDLDLVSNLMDSHKAFQKELGKRTGNIQALKRSARELMETGRDDTAWVKVQLQELSNRWDTVCALSVSKQSRLQQALKQAEEFRTAVQVLLEWLSEAEQTLRFRGVLPEEAETLQALLHTHRDFMSTVEEKRADVNKAAGMGEGILTVCHPDSITTIKHWITIIRARFEEVLTWAKQHEQRLETALTELLNNANLLEELLSWLQWAETTLVQRDTEPLPQDIPQLKSLITEHQMFMEEMTRKQPDVDKVTKTYKRKTVEPPSSLAERRGARKQQQQQQQQAAVQVPGGNPRLNQLCARWQQVWLLALDRQRKLNDGLDRLEELKEFANFDFDVWRKKYMRWMNHKKSRVMDFFRRIDKDQDGKITRQEFIDGILASKFPTSKLEMTAVADIFDRDGDGYIDYYEFVAALHPNKDAYRPTTDADKIEDEVTRQVAQCKCAKRFQVEQIGENKYRFFLGNQFGDSQQLRLVRILRSTVMVRVGGGWMALDEFLVKNDPCRARGRTNLELREKFILPEGTPQGVSMGVVISRSRGRRSKPGSRNASPTRSSSSASHSGASLPSAPSAPATPTASASSRSSHTHVRDYAKPWLAHSKTPTPTKCQCCPDLGHSHSAPGHEGAASGSKLKRPTLHSSRGSLTGENGGTAHGSKPDPKRGASTASGPTSRAGSRAGSRASSRRGSDASDASELQDARSVCSDTSDTPRRPGGGAKPSKIPTISKKTPSPKTPGAAKK